MSDRPPHCTVSPWAIALSVAAWCAIAAAAYVAIQQGIPAMPWLLLPAVACLYGLLIKGPELWFDLASGEARADPLATAANLTGVALLTAGLVASLLHAI